MGYGGKKSQLYKAMFPDRNPLVSTTLWFDLDIGCTKSIKAKLQTSVKIHKSGIWTGYGPNRRFFPDFSLRISSGCGHVKSETTVKGNSHKHLLHEAQIDKTLNDAFECLIFRSVFFESHGLGERYCRISHGCISEDFVMRFIKKAAILDKLDLNSINECIVSNALFILNHSGYKFQKERLQ